MLLQRLIIRHDSWAEGSCDTEDWSDKVENCITGINYLLKYITIESSYFKF